MTIILVIPATEGIVFAPDGQITWGMFRSSGTKIYPLNNRCLWSASGELALTQRVRERLTGLPDAPLPDLRDRVGQIITRCVTELLGMDVRTLREAEAQLLLQPRRAP